jgi:ferredoxin
VGTPKSKINQHEKKWLDLRWQKVRAEAGRPNRSPCVANGSVAYCANCGRCARACPSAINCYCASAPPRKKPGGLSGSRKFKCRPRARRSRATQQRDGHYSLRSNLIAEDPAVLWTRYVQLTQIESVFRSLKSELSIRPIGHQLEHRAEVWIPIVEVQETGTAVPSQPPPRIKASQITPKLGRRALSCGEAFG